MALCIHSNQVGNNRWHIFWNPSLYKSLRNNNMKYEWFLIGFLVGGVFSALLSWYIYMKRIYKK